MSSLRAFIFVAKEQHPRTTPRGKIVISGFAMRSKNGTDKHYETSAGWNEALKVQMKQQQAHIATLIALMKKNPANKANLSAPEEADDEPKPTYAAVVPKINESEFDAWFKKLSIDVKLMLNQEIDLMRKANVEIDEAAESIAGKLSLDKDMIQFGLHNH